VRKNAPFFVPLANIMSYTCYTLCMEFIRHLQHLYSRIADVYETQIAPGFAPLADDLAAWIGRCVALHREHQLFDPFEPELVTTFQQPRNLPLTGIDIGTGTGVLARALPVQRVIACDLSMHMLRSGKYGESASSTNVNAPHVRESSRDKLCADTHHLPLRSGTLDLVASTFGLNGTTPKQSLRELHRILKRRGVLAFQEWGAADEHTTILQNTLNEFAPDDVPMDDLVREYIDSPRPWYDQLQDTEDFYDMLKRIGFETVYVKEAPFLTVRFSDPAVFITHKLSWLHRRNMVDAMSESARTEFFAALHERLPLNTDGSLSWSPPLFRVFAIS
jgi:ubiquinone/menaquinone biosynthesis C-methylase UbiE